MINLSRSEQQKLAINRIFSYVSEGKIVLFKAPTGWGKTRVALEVGFLLNTSHKVKSTVITVRTRNQLSSFIRDLRKFFLLGPNKKVTFSVLVNKAASCLVYKTNDSTLIDCSKCRKDVIIDNAIDIKLLTYLEDYNTNDVYTILPYIKAEKICLYKSFFQLLPTDYTICTYPYIFLRSIRKILEIKLPSYNRFLVVDEAHNIERCIEYYTRTLSINDVDKCLYELNLISKLGIIRDANTYHSIHSEIYKIKDNLKHILQTYKDSEEDKLIPIDELYIIDDFIYHDLINIVNSFIQRILGKWKKIPEINIMKLVSFYKVIFEEDKKLELYKLFKAKDGVRFRVINPQFLAQFITSFKSCLLMSGTLPPEEYWVNVIGLPEDRLVYLDLTQELPEWSHFNIFIDTSVTTKYTERSSQTYDKYATIIREIYKRARKHCLVLVPNHEIARELGARLQDLEPLIEDVNVKEVGKAEEILINSEKKRILIIIAYGKFNEGIEFLKANKSLISDVIIVGVPYPKQTDYLREVIKCICNSSDFTESDYLMILAAIQIRQCMGRARRNLYDTVNVWLLDRRFADKDKWYKLLDITKEVKEMSL